MAVCGLNNEIIYTFGKYSKPKNLVFFVIKASF